MYKFKFFFCYPFIFFSYFIFSFSQSVMIDYLVKIINVYWRCFPMGTVKTHISTFLPCPFFWRFQHFSVFFFVAIILTTNFVLFSPPFSFPFSVLLPCTLSTSSTFASAFSFSRLSQDCVKIHWSIFWKYLVLYPLVAPFPWLLMRTFKARSPKLPFSSLHRYALYALPFSALIQVKRVSPPRPFSTYSPFLLVAKIFMALRSYRLRSLFAIEIHAAAFFGFSTLTAAFVVGLFTTAVSGLRVLFSSRGLRRTFHGTL